MNGINRSFPLDLLFDGSKQTHLEDSAVDNMKLLILNAAGIINIDVRDFKKTSSREMTNYGSTGRAEGAESVASTLKAVS